MTATGVRPATMARRAEHSRPFKRAIQAGLVAFGIMHLLVAWLGLQIAWGNSSTSGSQSGAFATLARSPGGKVLVILLGIALAALALWQALEAAVGHLEMTGKRRMYERIGSVFRAVVYAVLAWTSFQVAQGAGAQSSVTKQQRVTAAVMSHPGGTFLIGLVGLIVLGVGIGLIWYGWKKKFRRNLRPCPRWVTTLARFGYPAKGIAFGLVGVLMLVAAATYNPSKSGGLDTALHTLAQQPFGQFLLTIVALGFAAYGIYCFAQVRYRRI